MALTPELRSKIESIIQSEKVILFMKGSRIQPQCGFSATVVSILDQLLSDYRTFDVLSDPSLREGIKEFSSWPTIPQLYIDGEFVGGCDIVTEMFESGELQKALGFELALSAPPQIHISNDALEALKSAVETADDNEHIRLSIDARFEHTLMFDNKKANDVVVEQDGVHILFDPISAQRAKGLSIEFTQSSMGKGFKMTNPSAPQKA